MPAQRPASWPSAQTSIVVIGDEILEDGPVASRLRHAQIETESGEDSTDLDEPEFARASVFEGVDGDAPDPGAPGELRLGELQGAALCCNPAAEGG